MFQAKAGTLIELLKGSCLLRPNVFDVASSNCWHNNRTMTRQIRELKMTDGRRALVVARHNGISLGAFSLRIAKGMTADDAATIPLRNVTDR